MKLFIVVSFIAKQCFLSKNQSLHVDLNQCSWYLKYFHGFVPVLATIDKSFQQFFYDKPF